MIVCGYGHSASITADGKLFIWGFGEEGQLGKGNELNFSLPQALMTKSNGNHLDPPNVLHISLGKAHSMAVVSIGLKSELQCKLNPNTIRQSAITIQRAMRCYLKQPKVCLDQHICALLNANIYLF